MLCPAMLCLYGLGEHQTELSSFRKGKSDSHGPDCQIGTFSDRIVRVISLPPAYLHESGLCGSSVKTQYVVLARGSCDPPPFLGCGDFLSLD